MEEVEQTPHKPGFLRLEHSPCSPDLSPCGFFLFGYLHDKMQLLSDETIDELEEVITKTIEEIPEGALNVFFHAWRRGLQQCIQKEVTPLSRHFQFIFLLFSSNCEKYHIPET
jgi:hypothetical protein